MGDANNIDGKQVRILGDIIIVHADGLTRKRVRSLALECFKAMRTITNTEAHDAAGGQS